MNTEEIRTYLDAGLEKIDGETLEGLKNARMNALARCSAHALALEGHGTLLHQHRIGVWLPAIALALGLCAILYWGAVRQDVQPVDSNDIDAALLADELPVPAYTDQKFFDSWLKHSGR